MASLHIRIAIVVLNIHFRTYNYIQYVFTMIFVHRLLLLTIVLKIYIRHHASKMALVI